MLEEQNPGLVGEQRLEVDWHLNNTAYWTNTEIQSSLRMSPSHEEPYRASDRHNAACCLDRACTGLHALPGRPDGARRTQRFQFCVWDVAYALSHTQRSVGREPTVVRVPRHLGLSAVLGRQRKSRRRRHDVPEPAY